MSLVECILHEEKKMEDTADAKCPKCKTKKSHPQLYRTCGIMSMPVLGSTIGRKHSSMRVRAIANFEWHSATNAIFCLEYTFWSLSQHLRMLQENPSLMLLTTPIRERRPK